MTDKRYDVVFRGELAPGFVFEKVRASFVRSFSISEQKADRILKSTRVVLRRGLDGQGAKRYCAALRRMGMVVYLKIAPMERPLSELPRPPAVAGGKGRSGTQVVPPSMKDGVLRAKDIDTKHSSETIPFEFHGKGSEYFPIWLVNVFLSIVTLGIYSAWAKVRRKQYFYGSTRLQGAGFEYLADPVKILKGRLIVVGFFGVYSIVSELVPLVGAALALVFAFALPWLVVRSLAFNAHNSALRNIRFGFHGSYGEAARMFVLWPIAAVFTLGILSAYVYFRQKKFIVEHSSYGTTRCAFMAKGSDYYKIFLSLLLPVVAGGVIVLLAGAFFPPLAVLGALVLYLYAFAFMAVKTTNLLYNSSKIGEHRVQATMEVNGYAMVVLTNTVATALTLGLFHPWARVRAVRYRVEHLALKPKGDLDGFVAGEQKQVSALGDEMSDFLDFDFGL